MTSDVSNVADATTTAPTRRRRSGTGLSAMLLPELQSLAASLGISGTARMRKGELIAAITERQAAMGTPRPRTEVAAATTSTRDEVRAEVRAEDQPEGERPAAEAKAAAPAAAEPAAAEPAKAEKAAEAEAGAEAEERPRESRRSRSTATVEQGGRPPSRTASGPNLAGSALSAARRSAPAPSARSAPSATPRAK
ncbi:MAG: transcription termination factor Rho, partial [Actinobacteria bacterium]